MAQVADPNSPIVPGATSASSGRNQLALISMLLGFIFPVGLLVRLLEVAIHVGAKGAPASTLSVMFGILDQVFGVVSLPALVASLVMGHLALVRAKRYPKPQARRWMAIVGLVLSYLSVAFTLLVIGFFVLAGLNGF